MHMFSGFAVILLIWLHFTILQARAAGQFGEDVAVEGFTFGQFKCPATGYFPVKADCRNYYVCMIPNMYTFGYTPCPVGQVFDPVRRKCDQAANVDCNKCSADGYQKDPDSPFHYIACKNGAGSRLRCYPHGHIFSEKKLICVQNDGSVPIEKVAKKGHHGKKHKAGAVVELPSLAAPVDSDMDDSNATTTAPMSTMPPSLGMAMPTMAMPTMPSMFGDNDGFQMSNFATFDQMSNSSGRSMATFENHNNTMLSDSMIVFDGNAPTAVVEGALNETRINSSAATNDDGGPKMGRTIARTKPGPDLHETRNDASTENADTGGAEIIVEPDVEGVSSTSEVADEDAKTTATGEKPEAEMSGDTDSTSEATTQVETEDEISVIEEPEEPVTTSTDEPATTEESEVDFSTATDGEDADKESVAEIETEATSTIKPSGSMPQGRSITKPAKPTGTDEDIDISDDSSTSKNEDSTTSKPEESTDSESEDESPTSVPEDSSTLEDAESTTVEPDDSSTTENESATTKEPEDEEGPMQDSEDSTPINGDEDSSDMSATTESGAADSDAGKESEATTTMKPSGAMPQGRSISKPVSTSTNASQLNDEESVDMGTSDSDSGADTDTESETETDATTETVDSDSDSEADTDLETETEATTTSKPQGRSISKPEKPTGTSTVPTTSTSKAPAHSASGNSASSSKSVTTSTKKPGTTTTGKPTFTSSTSKNGVHISRIAAVGNQASSSGKSGASFDSHDKKLMAGSISVSATTIKTTLRPTTKTAPTKLSTTTTRKPPTAKH